MKKFLFGISVLSLLFSNAIQAQVTETESGMKWYSFEDAQLKAKEDGKKILIFGNADWCPYCRKMRKEVYSDSTIRQTIYEHFYPVQLDTESKKMVKFNGVEVQERELAGYLRLSSLPTHYFLSDDWEVLGAQPGFLPAEVFDPMLEYVGTDSFSTMEFDEFIKSKKSAE